MQFPFVTRSHHAEVVAQLKEQNADLKQELHRLKDLIFKNTFGVQLHDSLPAEPMALESPEVASAPGDRLEQEHQTQVAELESIRRTRPSQLGRTLERMMEGGVIDRARRAHPQHSVNPAQTVFEKAKAEALA